MSTELKPFPIVTPSDEEVANHFQYLRTRSLRWGVPPREISADQARRVEARFAYDLSIRNFIEEHYPVGHEFDLLEVPCITTAHAVGFVDVRAPGIMAFHRTVSDTGKLAFNETFIGIKILARRLGYEPPNPVEGRTVRGSTVAQEESV